MNSRVLWAALAAATFLGGAAVMAAPPSSQPAMHLQNHVNWPPFLARHDLIWHEIPRAWDAGAFLGNGLLGTMIWAGDNAALHWDVGRSDVVDRGSRIVIGAFVLKPNGTVQSGTMRLDLWNAEARGTLETDRGRIAWRAFTHAKDPITIVEMETSEGERGARLDFAHAPALPARETYQKVAVPPNQINPDPTFGETDNIRWCRQPFKAGGGYTVAWAERETAPGKRGKRSKRLVAFTVDRAATGAPASAQAVSDIRFALQAGVEKLDATHRAWWHAYWPGSFVSIPDTRMESFYQIQMYKLASGTRADRPALDLMGPWFRTTPWPKIWWNLNLQLTYWPVYAANRLELGKSLTRMMDADRENLIRNVPEAWRGDSAAVGRSSSYDAVRSVGDERGDLTWALHNYWLQYRYSGNETLLRNGLYPILKRAVGYYLHLLTPGDDNKLHLPLSTSPEYPDKAADTNYDLSLLRWGLTTLIATSERLHLNDPLVPRWRETLDKLTPYPTDLQTGYMIGANVPFAKSHRHFSHLLMVYPLHLVNPQSPADQPLIRQSLDHWMGLGNAHRGYSFTGASAISAWLGRGNDAERYLETFLDRYVKPNTMYLEAGPVIETPLSAAASLQEMLLQSWAMTPFGTDIRVFPAVPDAWQNVAFHHLRTEGAFLVSASRRDGRTRFVQIESLAGAPCRVRTDLPGPIVASGSRRFAVQTETDENNQRILTVDLRKGETVLLTSGAAPPTPEELVIAPVAAQPGRTNAYGLPSPRPVAETPR